MKKTTLNSCTRQQALREKDLYPNQATLSGSFGDGFCQGEGDNANKITISACLDARQQAKDGQRVGESNSQGEEAPEESK